MNYVIRNKGNVWLVISCISGKHYKTDNSCHASTIRILLEEYFKAYDKEHELLKSV